MIGSRIDQAFYNGAIDDVCIYSRALSAAEILELYTTGVGGNDIVFTNQPSSVTTNQGATVTFSSGAAFSSPLSYEWQFDHTNIAGATNSTLVLPDVQFANAGVYDVIVSSGTNSLISSNAVLAIVNPGAPSIFVNSNLVTGTASALTTATITMTPGFENGYILYSLSNAGYGNSSLEEYTGPFVVTNSVVIDAVCYSSDFSQSAEMQPLALQIIPVYSLTTSVVGGGTIGVSPNTNSFASNIVVTLTASASPNWAFFRWQGDITNYTNPLSLTVETNVKIQAVFTPTAFPLTLTTPGGGTVFASGQTTDGVNFTTNSLVTLAASNNAGWTFLGWQGVVTGPTNPSTLVMNQAATVVGLFGTSVLTNAVGGGEILLATTNLTPYGSNVLASAIANNGNYFALWGGAAGGTNSPVNATITNADAIVDALFLPLPANKLSLSVGVLGNGSVNINPPQSYYNAGDIVTLIPNNTSVMFFGWMGADNYTNRTTTVTMTTNLVVYANFNSLPPPSTAAATAILNGGALGQVVVTSGGFGYTNLPAVTIYGGGGSGATAVAVVQNGLVVAVNIINPGSGYTNTPQIIFEPPVILLPQVNIARVSHLTFSNLTVSGIYLLQQYVNQTWENLPQGVNATNSVMSQWVNGAVQPNSYRVVATPLPTTATAVAITNFGFVVSATVTSGGSGYTAPRQSPYLAVAEMGRPRRPQSAMVSSPE